MATKAVLRVGKVKESLSSHTYELCVGLEGIGGYRYGTLYQDGAEIKDFRIYKDDILNLKILTDVESNDEADW